MNVRVKMLKNDKAAGRDEVTGRTIKRGRVIIYHSPKFYDLVFESGAESVDLKSDDYVTFYKGSEGRSIIGNTYVGKSVDRVSKVIEGLTDNE